jgi:hypothetical protein
MKAENLQVLTLAVVADGPDGETVAWRLGEEDRLFADGDLFALGLLKVKNFEALMSARDRYGAINVIPYLERQR